MKGPFRRIDEATDSVAADLHETAAHLSRVANVGLFAFVLVALVAVTALALAADSRAA